MLQDPKIMGAVSRIVQRSERQEDVQKLVGTYVDVGLLPQLNNFNHQIFYGRRGTGKTHVMKVLESRLSEQEENTVVYIDCRTLGSTSQFSDPDIPMSRRCLALFRDFLLNIYHAVLEHIIEFPNDQANAALKEADNLAALITEPQRIFRAEKFISQQSSAEKNSRDSSAGMELSKDGVGARAWSSGVVEMSGEESRESQYTVEELDKVIFPDLQRSLKRVTELARTRLFILVDEWSSLPFDVQPYLAEFLKRGVLPLGAATLKISALEYRCRFSLSSEGTITGFELGADIATAPDLDDYFVFDRNPDQVIDIYADVLLRHMQSELPANYLKDNYQLENPKQFLSKLFTERNTFAELARASEGVMRDLINIFTQAFFNAQRRGRDSIDKKAILESARLWFEQDKAQYLDDALQKTLGRIVHEVIGQRRARSFLLPRELEKNTIIQKLFDARVLHHMQRGYADKDNPGIRYNIYAVDYGAYVDLIGTSKEPELDLQMERAEADEIVVPFDDKRSIRRIVLAEAMLQ